MARMPRAPDPETVVVAAVFVIEAVEVSMDGGSVVVSELLVTALLILAFSWL